MALFVCVCLCVIVKRRGAMSMPTFDTPHILQYVLRAIYYYIAIGHPRVLYYV